MPDGELEVSGELTGALAKKGCCRQGQVTLQPGATHIQLETGLTQADLGGVGSASESGKHEYMKECRTGCKTVSQFLLNTCFKSFIGS